jgi:HD-GYP domain-containing protein (c-di-GMP phosphodiesterase class II)
MTDFKEEKKTQYLGIKYVRAILNSINAQIAVLDKDGVIQEINVAWRKFSEENGGSPTTSHGIGLNYIKVCRQATGKSREISYCVADGIESVILGEKLIFNLEYPCQTPSEEKWFLCQVTPLPSEIGGVVVSHIEITEQKKAQKELVDSYETTLEGWSHAMDLRDKETEGHSQRVASQSMRIARAMGLDEKEIVNIRRGALLHDLGKIGIPDSILLKPGKLTDDEWVIMRKHPRMAYDMLSPIDYLKYSLDIPYCHHEKWDGTGYPRGLKGIEIPLTARIFAVVDVWDALRSDRPYRESWPLDKVREYIYSQSGKHFDPLVVDVFLKLLDDDGTATG